MNKEIIRMQNVSRVFYVNNCDTIFDYLKGKGFQKKKKLLRLMILILRFAKESLSDCSVSMARENQR